MKNITTLNSGVSLLLLMGAIGMGGSLGNSDILPGTFFSPEENTTPAPAPDDEDEFAEFAVAPEPVTTVPVTEEKENTVSEEKVDEPVKQDVASSGTDEDSDSNKGEEEEEENSDSPVFIKRLTPRKPRGAAEDAEPVGDHAIQVTLTIPYDETSLEKFMRGLKVDRKAALDNKVNQIIGAIPDWKDKTKEEKESLLAGVEVPVLHTLYNRIEEGVGVIKASVLSYISDQQERSFPTRSTGDGNAKVIKELKEGAITMFIASCSTVIAFTNKDIATKRVFAMAFQNPTILKNLVAALTQLRSDEGVEQIVSDGSGLISDTEVKEKLDHLIELARQYEGYLATKTPDEAKEAILADIA